MKKLVAILLSMLLILSLISCNKGEVKSGEEAKTETVEVTWWISRGEDSTYYMSYDDNPAVKYLETLDFNGKKAKIYAANLGSIDPTLQESFLKSLPELFLKMEQINGPLRLEDALNRETLINSLETADEKVHQSEWQ